MALYLDMSMVLSLLRVVRASGRGRCWGIGVFRGLEGLRVERVLALGFRQRCRVVLQSRLLVKLLGSFFGQSLSPLPYMGPAANSAHLNPKS